MPAWHFVACNQSWSFLGILIIDAKISIVGGKLTVLSQVVLKHDFLLTIKKLKKKYGYVKGDLFIS